MAGISNDRPTRVRWVIFALSCTTSFILYLHRYTWGFFKADVQEDFGWKEWELGLLDSLFSAAYAVGQIPSGVLCDWFGPHVLLGSIIVLWSLSMAGVTAAGDYKAMGTARVLFGITQAGCYPILGKVTKLWFPLSVRTSVQGWIATFFGRGGGAISFVLCGTVLAGWLELDWRTSILILTAVGAVFGVLFLLVFRNSPADHPWSNEAEAELVAAGSPAQLQATRSKLRWGVALRNGNLRVMFVQQFTSAYADNVYVYWIPLFLLIAKAVDVKSAGWMSAVPLVGGAIGGMLGGTLQNYLVVHWASRRWARSSIGLAGKMLATLFMFFSLGFDSAVVIVWIFFVVKFFGDWSQPAVWGTCTDIGGRNAASVFATVNTVGSIASFVAGPTMGLIIWAFSEDVAVQGERVATRVSSTNGEGEAVSPGVQEGPVASEFLLGHKAVVEGSMTGAVYDGEARVARFSVSEEGEFAVEADGDGPVPIDSQCALDRNRGKLTFAWAKAPNDPSVVVDYSYREYGSGWTALFIALGLIYLVSSLSWIWIDCTVPVDPGEVEG